VDEVRAESMAKALGVPMAGLVGEPQVKGNGKAKAKAEPKAGPRRPRNPPRKPAPDRGRASWSLGHGRERPGPGEMPKPARAGGAEAGGGRPRLDGGRPRLDGGRPRLGG